MSSTFFINPRSNPELRSLYRISMLPHLNYLQDYFLAAVSILSDYFPIEYSALLLQNRSKESLELEAVYGLDKEGHPPSAPMRKGLIGKAFESKQPQALHHLAQEPLYADITKGSKRIEKINPPLLCIPLMVEGEGVGVILINSLYGPRQEFSEDFQFFSIFSAIVSPVIKNYIVKREQPPSLANRPGATSLRLEEVLGEKLTDVINKVDPYVESRNKMCLFDDIIAIVEKILIQAALARVGYVQVAAAQLLGINRNTLRKKMQDLKIKAKP